MLAVGSSIAFAVAILALAASSAAAVTGRLPARTAYALAALIAIAAVVSWVAVADEPELATAVAAAGLTIAAFAEVGAHALSRLIARGRRIESEFARAETRLRRVVEREAEERSADLERTLARARADSVSLLADQERRLAEERRTALVEREAKMRDDLAQALSDAQQQVERRFSEWSQDLDRMQDGLAAHIARVGERQRELIAEVEARIAADADRIVTESEEQRAAVVRLREELGRSIEEIVQAANSELESQAADRRSALHDVAERLRRREQALQEQIAREESEATQRIAQGFSELERRHLEQLQRVVDRATSGYSEIAAQQFEEAIKNAREDAARRLGRELERAVATFEREAKGVLAEELSQIAHAGTQRLEKRLGQIAAGLERQRDEAVAALERRLVDVETEVRTALRALVADVDSDRAVLEARLQELTRRIEETYARSS